MGDFGICSSPICKFNGPIDWRDEFCTLCGAKLIKKCPNRTCQALLDRKGLFCRRCGEQIKVVVKVRKMPKPRQA